MTVSPRYGSVAAVKRLLDRDAASRPTDPPPELEDHEDTAAALPDDVLAERVDSAANLVDSKLAPHYAAVPFPDGEVPGIVVDVTNAIGAYLATLTSLQSEDLEKDDPVRLRYQWAVELLDQIAQGKAGLPGHVRAVAATGSGTMLQPRQPYDGVLFTGDMFGLRGP